jgi:hypothetical protein
MGLGGRFGMNFTNESSFEESFRCYSTQNLPGNARDNVDYGGKSNFNLTLLLIRY